jgi:lipoyl(octanoyl) transferase
MDDRPERPPVSNVPPRGPARRALAAWLGGRIGIDDYWSLAERLAWEVSEPAGRPPTLLVCELGPAITIGRSGSRADVLISTEELAALRLDLRFVGRGGGAVLHAAGQACVALFGSLEDLGLSRHDVGGHLARFEAALEAALGRVRCQPVRTPGIAGVFGRSGLLAALGVAVRRGVASHGAFVNVSPALDLFRRVRSVPAAACPTMGSVEAELRRKVRMQDVRTALVHAIGEAWDFPRVHVHAGLPLLPRGSTARRPEALGRVG